MQISKVRIMESINIKIMFIKNRTAFVLIVHSCLLIELNSYGCKERTAPSNTSNCCLENLLIYNCAIVSYCCLLLIINNLLCQHYVNFI